MSIYATIHIPNMTARWTSDQYEGVDLDASAENYRRACIRRLREVYGEEEEIDICCSWTERESYSSVEVRDLIQQVWERQDFAWVEKTATELRKKTEA